MTSCSKHACMQHKLCITATADCACPECETAFNEWAAERISARINPAIIAAEKRAAYAEESLRIANNSLCAIGDAIGEPKATDLLLSIGRKMGELSDANRTITLMADVLRVTERSEFVRMARALREDVDGQRAMVSRLRSDLLSEQANHQSREHQLMQANPETAVGDGLDRLAEARGLPPREPFEHDNELRDRIVRGAPIPMRITCPECGELHVDEGEFATKRHHTHSCQNCGLTWRPAKVDTIGVRFLPGFKNDTTVAMQSKQTELPLEPQS